MRMVEERMHIPLNTEIEEIFITDLIILGNIKELTQEEILKYEGNNV